MNARFIFSRVLSGLFIAASFFLVACSSTPQVYVPTERSYEQLRFDRQLAYNALYGYGHYSYRSRGPFVYGVATPILGNGRMSTQPASRGGASPAQGNSSQPSQDPSYARENLAQFNRLYQEYYHPDAPKKGQLSARDCQAVANEKNYLEQLLSRK